MTAPLVSFGVGRTGAPERVAVSPRSRAVKTRTARSYAHPTMRHAMNAFVTPNSCRSTSVVRCSANSASTAGEVGLRVRGDFMGGIFVSFDEWGGGIEERREGGK